MPLKTEALRSLQRKLCKRSGTFTVLFFGGIWKSQRPKSDLLEAATEVERKAHETLDVGSLSWKRQALKDILYRALKLGCEHVSNHGISGASLSDVLFVQCDGFDQFCMTWVIKRVSKHPEIWRSSLSNGWETLYISELCALILHTLEINPGKGEGSWAGSGVGFLGIRRFCETSTILFQE